MKRAWVIVSLVLAITQLTIFNGCKTTDEEEVLENFSITTASGYSLKVTVIPKNNNDDNPEYTSINLAASIRNHGEISGTITAWSFKIKRDIVTIVEINHNNYRNYKLSLSGGSIIPANEILDFFVGTPQPFMDNALPKELFSFTPYVPTQVVVDIEIRDDQGTIHTITGSGSYTYEESVVDET